MLFVVTSDPNKGMHRQFYKADAAIAITYGTLAAKALGLATCWLGLPEIAMKKNHRIYAGHQKGRVCNGRFRAWIHRHGLETAAAKRTR